MSVLVFVLDILNPDKIKKGRMDLGRMLMNKKFQTFNGGKYEEGNFDHSG